MASSYGTTGSAAGGAVTAGFTTLSTQATIAQVNSRGDIGGTLHDLRSGANVHGLVSAVLTGSITSGLNLGATVDANGAASQGWQSQLSQNLQAAGVGAVVNTAVNGASLERNLASAIQGALIDTAAAEGVNVIGDATTAGTTANPLTHAVAGCIGAAIREQRCAAGAIGLA